MPNLAPPIITLALVGRMLAVAPMAHGAPSIVGTWAPDPNACTPVGGIVAIGPMSLTGDDLACTFAVVSRVADVVIWHGRCSAGDAPPSRARVMAILQAGTLTITINGQPGETLRRCRPH